MITASLLTLATGCGARGRSGPDAPRPSSSPSVAPPNVAAAVTRDPRIIAARANVPVLCWHQLRDWRASDTSYNRTNLICPPTHFRAQLDTIQRAGYTTIDPDQYLAHLPTGSPLPPKPILLTFDDAQGSQMTNG